MLSKGAHVLVVDVLAGEELDLCNDSIFEQLLRLCFSGRVRFGAAGPPCHLYSRLRLKPGGPPALRTPEHLNGVPGLSARNQLLVDSSRDLLERCCNLLLATFDGGGHFSLEQPPTAMSWEEPVVQALLLKSAVDLVYISACSVGVSIHKAWMLATSFPSLTALTRRCEHPRSAHLDVTGLRDVSGGFVSQQTAIYPEQLASRFADIVHELRGRTGPHQAFSPSQTGHCLRRDLWIGFVIFVRP